MGARARAWLDLTKVAGWGPPLASNKSNTALSGRAFYGRVASLDACPPPSAQGFITGDAAAARHQTLPQLNNQPGPRGAARARTTHYSRKALLLRLKSLALSESAF